MGKKLAAPLIEFIPGSFPNRREWRRIRCGRIDHPFDKGGTTRGKEHDRAYG